MKHLIFTIFITVFTLSLNAQICNPPCTPDASCIEEGNPGEVCPLVLPTAMEGVYYDETVTIIPPSTADAYGVSSNIHSIKILSVNGLPAGMQWCKSQDVFLVTNPYTRYCAQLYGTPEQEGTYPISLEIQVYISIYGNPVQGPTVTDDTSLVIVVLPYVEAPVADFAAEPTSLEMGGQVNFTDLSTGSPTSWTWVFDGGIPPASTNQNPVVTYMNEGVYNVSLTVANDGGENNMVKTGYITVTNPSNIDIANLNFIKIYPNPAYDILTVEAVELESISIVDVLGKVVYSKSTNSEKETVDISSLPKANYFVKVKTSLGEIVKSISIK